MPARMYIRILLFTLLISGMLSPDASAQSRKYKRSLEKYTIPDITVINQDGRKQKLKDVLSGDQPVVIDFIYATCTTICPILSASYSNLQKKLGNDSKKVHLVSISIDPDHDTPPVMREYLERYVARPGWDFVTGKKEDIEKVMKALNVVIPDKMSHPPLYLMRSPGSDRWVRIYGLISTADFYDEYQKLVKK